MTPPRQLDLIKLDDVPLLDQDTVIEHYREHVSNSIALFLRLLGTDRIRITRAEGMYVFTADGRKILDFSGGLQVLNHGHNHPRVMEARRRFNEARELEICKAFLPHYQAVLAHNLAQVFGGDLQRSFFCNSGAEANEGALKQAMLYQGPSRDRILYTDMGYHGKTFGTMSCSGPASSPYSHLFIGLPGCIQVPWGNLGALEEAIARRSSPGGNDIAVMIMEAIKGDLVQRPPEGYLEAAADLLRRHDILLIFDEIFTNWGRTGEWFGYQHYGAVPDIVTFSKSLGGGKASIAGYIVSDEIFARTYGKPTRATVHSTTYGGMAEECATAIEAINVIYEEGLVQAARAKGAHMFERMKALAAKYPQYIKEPRCIGLMGILELRRSSELFHLRPRRVFAPVDDLLEGLLQGAISTELLRKHDMLHYTGGREDNLFLNPALIVTLDEIDRFMDALDEVMSTNLVRLGTKLLRNLVG